MIDRSGWRSVVQNVSPKDDGGHARFTKLGVDLLQSIERLIGGELRMSERPKSSAFVEEMRNKISQLELTSNGSSDEDLLLPTLNFQVTAPQISDQATDKVQLLVNALKRGFQKYSTLPVKNSVTYTDFIASCDDYVMPQSNRYEAQMPQIIVLTGCSIPDEKNALLEIGRYSPIIIIRTKYTLLEDKSTRQLEILLEDDIAQIISYELLRTSKISPRRMKSISVELVDGNKACRSENDRIQAKLAFEAIGQAFASSVELLIRPLLKDLSFLYGGMLHTERSSNSDVLDSYHSTSKPSESISLTTQVSASLPLPDEIIEINAEAGNDIIATKYISTQEITKWANSRLNKYTVKQGDNVHWALFVPSQDHSPLMMYNEYAGGEGTSITFATHASNDKALGNDGLSGLSLVNLDPSKNYQKNGHGDIESDRLHHSFNIATASSLLYLVGYIKECHGLPPVKNQQSKSTSTVSVSYLPPSSHQIISFWELESISRNHWQSSVEKVLHESENLMSLLYTHHGLAFPKRLAQRLNDATHLIRHSISLSEKGYPTQYATSAMYKSMHYLESIMSDPDLMELPHFAIDHYLAVFSPLILPLLMPLVLGLVREIKRYRNLKNKIPVN